MTNKIADFKEDFPLPELSRRVLLSTDIGSDPDDALSLLAILNSGINLEGIITVNGNVESRCCIAQHLINLFGERSGRKIPVAKGESQPLDVRVPPFRNFEDCLVDWSFIDQGKIDVAGDFRFKKLSGLGIIDQGIKFLAGELSKRSYTIFNIAPLTNLAKLIEHYPQSARSIEKVYVMGCRFSPGDLEHNIRHDLKAAEIVFQSDLPLIVVPGDVCEKYRMPDYFLEQMQSSAAKYVQHMTKAYLGLSTAKALASRQIAGESMPKIIIDYTCLPHQVFEGLSFEEKVVLSEKKKLLLRELDNVYFPLFEPEQYFKCYSALVEHLNDPRLNFKLGNIVARELERIRVRDLSVADVFVPYCFLHPDQIKTKKGTVKFTSHGESYLKPEKKHEIVTAINYNHFQEFLKKYLR